MCPCATAGSAAVLVSAIPTAGTADATPTADAARTAGPPAGPPADPAANICARIAVNVPAGDAVHFIAGACSAGAGTDYIGGNFQGRAAGSAASASTSCRATARAGKAATGP